MFWPVWNIRAQLIAVARQVCALVFCKKIGWGGGSGISGIKGVGTMVWGAVSLSGSDGVHDRRRCLGCIVVVALQHWAKIPAILADIALYRDLLIHTHTCRYMIIQAHSYTYLPLQKCQWNKF